MSSFLGNAFRRSRLRGRVLLGPIMLMSVAKGPQDCERPAGLWESHNQTASNLIWEVAASGLGPAYLQEQGGAADPKPPDNSTPPKKAPSFGLAGIQGTTAPSGYSAAASAEEMSRAIDLVVTLPGAGWRLATPSESLVDCGQEAALIQGAHEHPARFDANHRLGLFYLQHGEATESIPYLKKAATLNPRDFANSRTLVVSYIEAARYSEADSLIQSLIQVDGADPVPHLLLGEVYTATNRHQEAIVEYRLAAGPDSPKEILFASGLGLLKLGVIDEAAEIFRSSSDLYPSFGLLWIGRGIAEGLQNRKLESLRSLVHAVSLDPSNEMPYFFLANLSGLSKDADAEIGRAVEQFSTNHPNSAMGHYANAMAIWRQQRGTPDKELTSHVESDLVRAIQLKPGFAIAHFQLGVVYSESGDCKAAVPEFRQAIALEARKAEWHYRLFQAYKCAGQPELATRELTEFEVLRTEKRGDDSHAETMMQGLDPWDVQQESLKCNAMNE